MSRHILILGAASAIAQAYARRRAAQGCSFILVGRHEERLAAIAADLRACGALSSDVFVTDLGVLDQIEASAHALSVRFAEPDELVVAYGMLGNQPMAEQDLAAARALIDTNFTSQALWILAFLKGRSASAPFTIVAIGSVAGDRGRVGNFIYGAAKGALHRFMEGLTHKYAGTAVLIVTVKPGFVDTPMTVGIKKSGPLWASPDRIAADIERAVAKGRRVVYTPWFWRVIMTTIRHLPWFVFRRLKI
jgi:short-subunit dehydrogenase